MNPPSEFGLFYALWGDRPEWFNVDVSGVPYRQDMCTVSVGSTPTYPQQGPHMIELYPGGKEAFYNQFLQELRTIVTGWFPMADYDGIISLDYEFFGPNWTGHRNYPSTEGRTALDGDCIDDWRETLRETRAAELSLLTPTQQEEYFKQAWLATTREFFERTYAAVKQLRPRAKVGFYNQPAQCYWEWRDPVKAAAMRTGNTDEAAWFWQMVDVILPSVYPLYQSVPEGQALLPGQDREQDFEAYVRANVGEAVRVANGKPVYPYIGFQYHPSCRITPMSPVNDFAMRRPLEISRELGCNGVVIWGWFQNQQRFDEGRAFFQTRYAPFLRQFSLLPALAPANPQPVGGAGGGAPSGGGSGTGTGTGTGAGSGTGTTTGGGSTGTTGGAGGGGGSGAGGGATGPGNSNGSGSSVVSVGGGSGSGSSGSGVVSVGGGGSSSVASGAAPSSAAAVAGGGGSSGGGSGAAGGGGTAIAGGAASGTNAVGVVSSFYNDGSGGGVGSGPSGGGGITNTAPLSSDMLALVGGPVTLGDSGGVAVVPTVDLQGADIHAAPADPAGMDLAKNRTLGVGDGSGNLDGARIVRPGSDEVPMMLTSINSDEPFRIVRPGMDGGRIGASPLLAAGGLGRVVRPGGATGAGATGALLSTAQLAKGGRFVRPGQGVDVKPVEKLPPVIAITDVPTPQP